MPKDGRLLSTTRSQFASKSSLDVGLSRQEAGRYVGIASPSSMSLPAKDRYPRPLAPGLITSS